MAERSQTLDARTRRREEYRRQVGHERGTRGFLQDLLYIGSDRPLEARGENPATQAAAAVGATGTGGGKWFEGPTIGGALALALVGGKVANDYLEGKMKGWKKSNFRSAWSSAKGLGKTEGIISAA